MNSNLSSAHLKSLAREQLLGKYGLSITAEIIVSAIIFGANMLVSLFDFADQSSTALIVALFIMNLITSFIVNVFSGILYGGLARFYLNLVCAMPAKASDVLYCFKTGANKALLVKLFTSVIELIIFSPAYAWSLWLVLNTQDILDNPASMLGVFFLIGGIYVAVAMVLTAYVELTYSQVYYVMHDFPSYSAREILAASRRIMKGRKGRLLYINVSLLPMYLAAFVSCGIATFWIRPYERAIKTNFYLNLMKES